MTLSSPEVDPEDAAAIAACNEALLNFTTELNRLHIAFGAPSYATLVEASAHPKLTKAGINEVLSGKRLPSLEVLLEFVRVVSNPRALPDGVPATHRARPELVSPWRSRWQEVKLLQRQAQDPWKHLRTSVQDTLDQARNEAETTRTEAHEEAQRILEQARVDAEEWCEARKAETELLLADHKAKLEEVRRDLTAAKAEAERVRSQARRAAAEIVAKASAEAEQIKTAAEDKAERIINEARKKAGLPYVTTEEVRWDELPLEIRRRYERPGE
ncbi:hypothetical protein ABZ923_29255 [Streptomyces sp. NPDC046881]|uniref:hypothetical protein n=1 Tax=Streptomyces sp. NPDC046881 TaxID=3155374 RepID=UPI0033D9268B